MFKKLLSLALSAVMVMGMSTSALAATPTDVTTNETLNNSNSIRQIPNAVMEGVTEMRLGETKVIGYIGDEPLKITLISEDINDSERAAYKTARKNYGVTYLDKPAFDINLVADYYHDDINSRMVNLNGKFKIINSSFSASWDTSQNTANDTYHGMTLDVFHFSGNANIRLEAWIIPNSTGGVTFYIN